MIGYELTGHTLVLDGPTTAAWDSDDARVHDDTRRAVLRDARTIASRLGRCEIQTCDGVVLERVEVQS